jgi:hypothetical protein
VEKKVPNRRALVVLTLVLIALLAAVDVAHVVIKSDVTKGAAIGFASGLPLPVYHCLRAITAKGWIALAGGVAAAICQFLFVVAVGILAS